MNDSTKRHERWRRTVAAGFIASLAIHGAVLAFVHLEGGFTEREEARQARVEERAQQWERQAIQVVEVREQRFDAGELAPRPPIRGAEATAAVSRRSEPVDRPDARYGAAGSSVASAALTSLASAETSQAEAAESSEVADGTRVVKSTGQPASVRPVTRRQGATSYRPANSAARHAARSGEPPSLGAGTIVVDDRGRVPGRDGDRWGRSGGFVGGGSCGTGTLGGGGAIVDRAIPDGILFGG